MEDSAAAPATVVDWAAGCAVAEAAGGEEARHSDDTRLHEGPPPSDKSFTNAEKDADGTKPRRSRDESWPGQSRGVSRAGTLTKPRLEPLPEQIVARSAKLPPVSPEISSGSLPSAMRRDRSRSNTASRLSLTCERMGPFPAPASLGVRDPYFLRSSAPASPFGPDGEPLPDAVSDGDGASEGRPTSSSSAEDVRDSPEHRSLAGIDEDQEKEGGTNSSAAQRAAVGDVVVRSAAGTMRSADDAAKASTSGDPRDSRRDGVADVGPGTLPTLAPGSFRLHAVTWNMAQGDGIDDGTFSKPGSIPDLLVCRADSPGLIAVGTQESGRWEDFTAAVAQSAGTAYSVLASVRQGALGMLVLCHGSLRPMVREVRTGSYLLSVKEMVNRATKGAVGVSVRMRGGVSALLVNSHLPAGETKWRERNSAYHKIKRNLLADMAAELHAKNATRVHDLTVWMGDLNYRVRSNRAAADRVLAMGMPEVLAGNDQLRQEQRHRRAYVHFTEGPLAFPPTYKFDLGTDQYDTSKKERVPSWTDRVLFKTGVTLSTENVRVHRYTSVAEMRASDHKPVVCTMDVGVDAWVKTWRTEAGMAEDRVVLMQSIGCCIRAVELGPGLEPLKRKRVKRPGAKHAVMPSEM